jgi:hypothetical protein
MTAFAYYELKSHYTELEGSLQKDIDQLTANIKNALTIQNGTKAFTEASYLHQMSQLRTKAIAWLSTQREFDFSTINKEVYEQIELLTNNDKLGVLAENICFAFRCRERILKAILQNKDNPALKSFENIEQTSLIFQEQLTDFLRTSLALELCMIAAALIDEENLEVSEHDIDQLAFSVADLGQNYWALASILGIVKSTSTEQSLMEGDFDEDFINKQKTLADLGLEEYLENLPKF